MQEGFLQDGHGHAFSGLLDNHYPRWHIKKRDVWHAIKVSGNTMLGPDGIPYKAWKILGQLAVDTLFDVAQTLSVGEEAALLREAYMHEELSEGHEFNASILCCLPKKRTGVDAEHGDYYEAAATRPLAIVNIDNRVIANAARACWEPIFNRWPVHHRKVS